jgi:nicotinamide mononucleotide transporter
LPVSRWRASWHAVAIVGLLAVSAVNGWIVARGQGGWVPYVDAFVAWVSVLATWMVARKVLENWLYWIVLDFAAAVLAAWQGLAATSMLFLLYTAMAVQGHRQWLRDARAAR